MSKVVRAVPSGADVGTPPRNVGPVRYSTTRKVVGLTLTAPLGSGITASV